MRRAAFILILIIGTSIFPLGAPDLFACDACQNAIARSAVANTDKDRFFLDFMVEHLNWEEKDARQAHALHHAGHHFHDKTHENFYRFLAGVRPMDRWTFLGELPYVERHSLEVDDHARLGQKEISEGLGDLKLTAIYELFQFENGMIGPLAGVKFPTGETHEKNSQGVLFEPELQPGSGSDDYTGGFAFRWNPEPWTVSGNMNYTIKSEGSHNFKYGDTFSLYAYADYLLFRNEGGAMKIGGDMNWQIEDKQQQDGAKIADSGGNTVLIGPSITLEYGENISIFGNFLWPIHQNLGGVHQELEYSWNAGVQTRW